MHLEPPGSELLARYTPHHDSVASDPEKGQLCVWRFTGPNEGYIPVGAVGVVSTGIALSIPAGVIVEVRGLPENAEKRRLEVLDRRFVGPVELPDIQVVIFNRGYTSGKLEIGERIAEIRATIAPPYARWLKVEPKAQ